MGPVLNTGVKLVVAVLSLSLALLTYQTFDWLARNEAISLIITAQAR